jgi:cobalt/nickel transport system permease protein
MQQLTRHKINSDHPLTRFDPRVKLISTMVLLIMVISSSGVAFPLLAAAISLALCLSMGIRPKLLLTRFAQPLFIALVVVLLKLFFSGSTTLFSLHIFGMEAVAHKDGLLEGLFIASRIAGAVSLVALLGFSTSFTDLMAALAWLRAPRGFIEVSLFAWRFLFVLFDDAQVIYAAQKNRLGYAGFQRGMRSFGTLAGALVIKAFDNSQTLTCAMVQRGYDGTTPLLRHKPFKFKEVALSMTFILAMGIVWRI